MITKEPTLRIARSKDNGFIDSTFMVVEPMRYEWKTRSVTIEVPAGFVTDFASIPRLLRPFIPINGAHRLPALLHDYLYESAGRIETETQGALWYAKSDADNLFKQAMLEEGVSAPVAQLMYLAVRIFGNLHRKLTKSGEWKTEEQKVTIKAGGNGPPPRPRPPE